MNGAYHERAVCKCGWTNTVSFGNLAHLTGNDGQFINYCPTCGRPKHTMEVMLVKWERGTWRKTDGTPFDGKEPTPEENRRATLQGIGCLLACLAALAVFLYLIWDT